MSKRTIVIKNGETFILPKNATIDSMIVSGVISATSSCNNLPAPSSYKCGYFYIICDYDTNTTNTMDEDSTHYDYVKVGTNTYDMAQTNILLGQKTGVLVSTSVLNTHIPDQVLFSFTAVNTHTLTDKQLIRIYFRVPESLWDEVELGVNNGGSHQIYRPIEAACDSYPSEP